MVTLAGCYASPVTQGPSNNPEVPVALLFSHDGCDVYRFDDQGAHYFARCRDSRTLSSIKTQQCGRAVCDEEIPVASVR